MSRWIMPLVVAAFVPMGRAQQYELTVVEPNSTYPLAISVCADITDTGWVMGSNENQGTQQTFEWRQSHGLRYPPVAQTPRRLTDRGDLLYSTLLVYADGTSVEIPDLQGGPGINVSLRDLNRDRIVVGSSPGSGNTSSILIWDPIRGSRNIDIWAAKALLRVNAFDQAVGYSSTAKGSSDGFVCNIETGTFVQFNGLFGAPWSEAIDVNELGVVVGRATLSSGTRAFIWDSQSGMTLLPGLDGGDVQYVLPRAIDNKGRVVGQALTGTNDWRAFVWEPLVGMTNLHTAHDQPGTDFELIEAKDISETGVIIGNGYHGPVWGPQRGFILNPGGAWADLGLGRGGALGKPVLQGVGELKPGFNGRLEIVGAHASSSGSLLVSFSYDPTRMFGGVVAALPAQIVLPIQTNGIGSVSLPFTTPANAPSGFRVFVQAVILDPTAPNGLAISNALRGLVGQ
ncbi:MAG: hypothetical protein RL885_07190 [Planctomycetota bacterium]